MGHSESQWASELSEPARKRPATATSKAQAAAQDPKPVPGGTRAKDPALSYLTPRATVNVAMVFPQWQGWVGHTEAKAGGAADGAGVGAVAGGQAQGQAAGGTRVGPGMGPKGAGQAWGALKEPKGAVFKAPAAERRPSGNVLGGPGDRGSGQGTAETGWGAVMQAGAAGDKSGRASGQVAKTTKTRITQVTPSQFFIGRLHGFTQKWKGSESGAGIIGCTCLKSWLFSVSVFVLYCLGSSKTTLINCLCCPR